MRLSSSTGRRIVAGLGAGATVLAVVSIAQPASAASARRVVSATRPTWTGQAKDKGHSAKSTRIDFGVLLKMRNQSQADATLQRISDPKSADYGKWLTNAQFNAAYAPKAADVSAVRSWLRSQGFTTKTLQSGMYVEVSGTTAQVEKAFGTSMNTYTYKGRTVLGNTTALSVPSSTPAAVTNAIQGIVGVDQGAALKVPASSVLPGPPPGARYGVQPCSSYYGEKVATDKPKAYGAFQPYAVCGYYPLQYQAAYGEAGLVKSGVDGSGVTVAITDGFAAPTMLSDAQTYSKLHGLPAVHGRSVPRDPAGQVQRHATRLTRRAGTARRPSTSRPCTAWLPGANVVYVAGADDFTGLDTAWARDDRQPRGGHHHQLVDRRHGRRQPARPGLRRLLHAVLARGGADRHHGQLLLR